MDFKLQFEISKADFNIQHGESIVFLGSCFSDEMAAKASYYGFPVLSNPFGTVFHPSVISRFILESIQSIKEERIFQREDLFLSWDANSTIFDYSEEKYKQQLQAIRSRFVETLSKSKLLFITFGTAWGYELNDQKYTVANCHKVPNTQFTKRLSLIEELEQEWLNTITILQNNFPDLKIVFTVSPVRHVKDGLVENNQSKAILIELVRRLNEKTTSEYFPSYEIMIDELRDYRFYKTDRVHPSEEAIEYIWKRFESKYCSE